MKNLLLCSALLLISLNSALAFRLRCKVENGCAFADRGDLGYCVKSLFISKSGASVERGDLFTERFLFPIEIKNVFQDKNVIIASEELTVRNNKVIFVGENVISLKNKLGKEYSRYVGTLILEEDFSFDTKCDDETPFLE